MIYKIIDPQGKICPLKQLAPKGEAGLSGEDYLLTPLLSS
jgi:hypothetical protein